MVDPWIYAHALLSAHAAAQDVWMEEQIAAQRKREARELERAMKHATSIEVEAQWVEEKSCTQPNRMIQMRPDGEAVSKIRPL